jgi:hypothetical protein
VTESMETTTPNRTIGRKVRNLAIGALAAAALSVPAVTAVSVVHQAIQPSFGHSQPSRGGISPDSHRLALSIQPNSLRLT